MEAIALWRWETAVSAVMAVVGLMAEPAGVDSVRTRGRTMTTRYGSKKWSEREDGAIKPGQGVKSIRVENA